jgi:hypothetical protein
LNNISEELNSSHARITSLEQQLRTERRWVLALGALCVLRLILYAIGVLLYVKGIKVPRWVDILL